jgi:Flp pilus assembly protein TadG
MRRSRFPDRWHDDRGSAALEFLVGGLILLLPMVYLILTMAQVQAGALAVEGAARHAARVYVRAASTTDAANASANAVRFTLDDYGVDPAAATTRVECSPNPASCLERRGIVTITVSVSVALPLAPSFLTGTAPLSVPVSASATQQVSRFRVDG